MHSWYSNRVWCNGMILQCIWHFKINQCNYLLLVVDVCAAVVNLQIGSHVNLECPTTLGQPDHYYCKTRLSSHNRISCWHLKNKPAPMIRGTWTWEHNSSYIPYGNAVGSGTTITVLWKKWDSYLEQAYSVPLLVWNTVLSCRVIKSTNNPCTILERQQLLKMDFM